MKPLLLTLTVLVTASVSMTVVCIATGVMQPRGPRFRVVTTPTGTAMTVAPPFTPVEEWLQIETGLSWLAAFGAAVGLGVRRLANRQRARTEESR